MKHFIKSGFFAFGVLIASPTTAQATWFVSAKLGHASPSDSYSETNFNFVEFGFEDGTEKSLSFGKISNQMRIELEYSIRSLDADYKFYKTSNLTETLTGNQKQKSIFINSYYYPIRGKTLSMFFGAGIGKTDIKWNEVTDPLSPQIINDKDSVLSYKLSLGIEAMISNSISMEATYNYLKMDDASLLAGNQKGKLNNQNLNVINIGMSYSFD